MSKKLPIKYVSETAVKQALKIDTFREMSKEKIMQFASMIPYMDKDVAIAIINQFPILADFGKTAISCYMHVCDNLLENNKDSQSATIHGYQTILDALSKRMESENITEKERKSITEDMISVADKIAEVDVQNKKFLDGIATKGALAVLGIAALVGAGIGINSAFGGRGELPQIDDNVDDEDML